MDHKRKQKHDSGDLPAAKRRTAGNPVIIDLSGANTECSGPSTPQPYAVMKRLPPISGPHEFPRFKNGTVVIILDPKVEKYQYILHINTLSHASPKLANLLKDTLLEASDELKVSATDAQFRFELVYSSKVDDWILRKTSFTAWKIPGGNGGPKASQTPLGTDYGIKEEPRESSEHKEEDNCHAKGVEVAHEESKDPAAETESTNVSVSNGDSTIPGQATDDSVQGISSRPYPFINIPNNSEKNISPPQVPIHQIRPERRSTSSDKYVFPPVEVCEAYHNLFLTFYTLSPEISNSDIWFALGQCENVLVAAEYTGSIPTVRRYVEDALLRFGDNLLEAIPYDPYRWLSLSLDIHCKTIFREAMIHIVGQYSLRDDFDNTIPSLIPIPVQDMIIRKVRLLDSRKSIVNERILLSTITIDGDPVTPLGPDPKWVATWYLVQVWRDWFSREFFYAYLDPQKTGALYRKLQMGGNKYLPALAVKRMIDEIRSPIKVNIAHLESDLNLLKEVAQKAVKDLCKDRSVINLKRLGWTHLTSVRVKDEELPWYSPEDS